MTDVHMFMSCAYSFNSDISGRYYSITEYWWVCPYFPFFVLMILWYLCIITVFCNVVYITNFNSIHWTIRGEILASLCFHCFEFH